MKYRIFSNRGITIISLIVALIATGITIYVAFIQDENPRFDYVITNRIQLLTINNEISKLSILYNNEDITKKNQNLSIYTLKVQNDSRENIKSQDFNKLYGVGLNITNGKIIENPQTIDASTDFLKKNAFFKFDSTSGNIYYSNTPLDNKSWFTMKLMLIHPMDSIPRFNPIGKISGIKKIDVLKDIDLENAIIVLEVKKILDFKKFVLKTSIIILLTGALLLLINWILRRFI